MIRGEGKSVFQDLRDGLTLPIHGMKVLRQHPTLLLRAVLPFVLSISIVGASVLYGILNATSLLEKCLRIWLGELSLSELYSRVEAWKGIWGSVGGYGLSFLLVLGKIAVVLLVFFLAFLLAKVVSSFFWDLLVEKTLATLGRPLKNLGTLATAANILSSVFRELIMAVVLLLIPILIWVLALIPLIGPVVGIVAFPFLTFGVFGYSLFNYAWAVENQSLQYRRTFSREHLLLLMGGGLIGAIPLLNIILSPLFIVGATALYVNRATSLPRLDGGEKDS